MPWSRLPQENTQFNAAGSRRVSRSASVSLNSSPHRLGPAVFEGDETADRSVVPPVGVGADRVGTFEMDGEPEVDHRFQGVDEVVIGYFVKEQSVTNGDHRQCPMRMARREIASQIQKLG